MFCFGFFLPPDLIVVAAAHLAWGFSFSCSLGLVFLGSKMLLSLVLVMRTGIPMPEPWYDGKSMRDSALQTWKQTLCFIQVPLHNTKGHFPRKQTGTQTTSLLMEMRDMKFWI